MPSYDKIAYTKHALIRMGERAISKKIIEKVISEPTNELPTVLGRHKFWKKIDNKRYTVVLEEKNYGKKAIIITTY